MHPSFKEALRFWFRLGFISFGGTTGHLAIMHAELVEKRRWISESRFLHALNYCMLLPGPEATQLAIYIGWLLHGTWGGIVAGTLFVLPAAILLWLLSFIYVTYGAVAAIAAMFYGLKASVIAIVAFTAVNLGRKALKNVFSWMLAAGAFAALFVFKISFPIVIATAGLIGLIGGRLDLNVCSTPKTPSGEKEISVISDEFHSIARPTLARAVKLCSVWLPLWWGPVFLLGIWKGWNSIFFQEGVFFGSAAVVTVGGSYAVLPYVAQRAVEHYGWLTRIQMLDGLGLAETTPGPLIIVLQFAGFLGGWNHPGDLPPLLSATICAAITTWTTFVPCFFWIFIGAPYIELMRGHATLNSALCAITAAVVGVILNLAVWFAVSVIFPDSGGMDWFIASASIIGFLGMIRFKWDVIPVVAAGAALGLVRYFIFT